MKLFWGYLALALAMTSVLVLAEENDPSQTENPDTIMNEVAPKTTTSTTTTTTSAPTTSTPKSKSNKSNNKPKASDSGSIKATDCPAECSCVENRITCDDKKLTSIPNFSKISNGTRISLRNNLIQQLNFGSLPLSTLEFLDLYNNTIKTIVLAKKMEPLTKLKTLNLGMNQLENLTNSWSASKFPVLENLDLSYNPFEDLGNQTFDNFKNLQVLKLDSTKLKSIHESAFLPLTQLISLNMSGVRLFNHLGDKQFASNQKLEVLDLTNNGLIEVPFALRSTSSLKTLILNENLMRSLRQSDFINRSSLVTLEIRRSPNLLKIDEFAFSDLDNLKKLIISDNPQLYYVSKEAFKSDKVHEVDVFDLTGNNITTMSNPLEFSSVTFEKILLSNNPWNCNCDLKWLQLMDQKSPPIHCKTPEQFRDMAINQYFLSVECEADSSYRGVVVTAFLLFLFALLAAVFVQKSEVCRRLLWKDQYGSIYYTKASFPPETV